MEKQQGGEENEFNFGCTEFEGSLAPLRGVGSYGDEYGGLGSAWRLGLRCPENMCRVRREAEGRAPGHSHRQKRQQGRRLRRNRRCMRKRKSSAKDERHLKKRVVIGEKANEKPRGGGGDQAVLDGQCCA